MVYWGRPVAEFWSLHPREYLWAAEAEDMKHKARQGQMGGLSRDEAMDMADELRHYRVSKGFPPE